ncbi:hypothetical protein BC943DRAFT_364395 [Umbelopsis sp. AD052]|nr:hypothetical protein BC943DRAFT_364395 [Umbelopsis sp. AD052]
MFKKQPSIKNYSALKSSDRRRFQSDVFDSYPTIKEFHSVEGAPSFFTEDLQKAKFSSHIDDLGLVYAMDNSPTWFQVNGTEPIPTDLMIPGLVAGSEGLPNLKAGDLVAICINGYKYPLAVGRMALDTSNIAVRSGMKGKAVNLIHVYQDCLWAMGDKSEPPNLESIERSEDSDDEEDDEDVDDLAHQTQSRLTVEEQKDRQQDIPEEDSANVEEKPQLSTNDIDQLVKDTFYQALVYKLTKGHSPELLPMSASTLYSTYMLPSRPLVNGSEVDVKKSSWKKMQKFLKDMEKAGVCKLKDRKGETHVVSINWSHEALTTAKKYKTLASKPSNAAEKSALPEAFTEGHRTDI